MVSGDFGFTAFSQSWGRARTLPHACALVPSQSWLVRSSALVAGPAWFRSALPSYLLLHTAEADGVSDVNLVAGGWMCSTPGTQGPQALSVPRRSPSDQLQGGTAPQRGSWKEMIRIQFFGAFGPTAKNCSGTPRRISANSSTRYGFRKKTEQNTWNSFPN